MDAEEYEEGSDYDIRPEVGRKKAHNSDSDSDDESTNGVHPKILGIAVSPAASDDEIITPAPAEEDSNTPARPLSNAAAPESVPDTNPFLRKPSLSWRAPSFSAYATQPTTLLSAPTSIPFVPTVHTHTHNSPASTTPTPAPVPMPTSVPPHHPVPLPTSTPPAPLPLSRSASTHQPISLPTSTPPVPPVEQHIQEPTPEKPQKSRKKEKEKSKDQNKWRVKGYVNEPQLSAQNGATMSGLKGTGPYNSLYRAQTGTSAPLVPPPVKVKKTPSHPKQPVASSSSTQLIDMDFADQYRATLPSSSSNKGSDPSKYTRSEYESRSHDSFTSSAPSPTPILASKRSRAGLAHPQGQTTPTTSQSSSSQEYNHEGEFNPPPPPLPKSNRGQEREHRNSRQKSAHVDRMEIKQDDPSQYSIQTPSSSFSASTQASHYESLSSPARGSSPTRSTRTHHSTAGTPSASKVRMVTVLIDDRRTGVDELAEIKVPLKPADDAEGGYWADAGDVCEKLQTGPSRIDGPAKVYAMRGKYRQTFLRISADNVETSQSANLRVAKDKTLEVFVEGLAIPQSTLSADSRAPTLRSVSMANTDVQMSPPSPVSVTHGFRHSHPLTPFSASGMSTHGSPRRSESRASNKRKRASSRESRDVYDTPAQSPAYPHSPRPHRSQSPQHAHDERYSPGDEVKEIFTSSLPNDMPPKKPKRGRSHMSVDLSRAEESSRRSQTPHQQVDGRAQALVEEHGHHRSSSTTVTPNASQSRIESVTPASSSKKSKSKRKSRSRSITIDAPPGFPSPPNTDHVVSEYMRKVVEQQEGWDEFNTMMEQKMSHAESIKQYWFVQSIMDKFVGGWTPMDLGEYQGQQIKVEHVAAAMDISVEWYQHCRLTLGLLIQYGKGGTRYEDERVMASAADQTPVVPDGSFAMDLFDLLCAVDAEWKRNTQSAGN